MRFLKILIDLLRGLIQQAMPIDTSLTLVVSNDSSQRFAVVKVKSLQELRLPKNWSVDHRSIEILKGFYVQVQGEELNV